MKKRFNKFLILLAVLLLGIGQMWAQLTPALPATTLTLPTIPTEGWKGTVTPTYYKAEGSNVYVFSPYELYLSVANLTWTTQNSGGNTSATPSASAPFPASSIFTGYKAATLNNTSKGPYAYRVTNCVAAYVYCKSGSDKKRTITLAAYEVDGDGNVAASAAESSSYEKNSDGVISITLNKDKEYYIKVSQVGSGSGGSSSGNSSFYMIAFQAPYKVTLDPDGGSYPSNTLAGWTYDNVNDKYSKYVAAGSLTLPSAPSKGGYDFTEWQDNKANAYTTSITIDKDTVLTAQWIAAGSAYDVNIASMTNGSVVASPTSQVEDGTVTLTVTPDDGYLLSSLSVIGDVSGDEVTVTANQFTMPAEDVTVNATFSLAPTYTVTLNPAGGTIVDATGWTLNAGNYEKEVAEGTVLTLPTFTKTDRAFKTWRKAGPADVASPVTVDGNLSLTAIWTATIEQVIYSWESPEGTPIEVGGTATSSTDGGSSFDDAQINVTSAGYHCLQLNGNNSFGNNLIQIELSGTETVKTGDKIKYTGFYTNTGAKNTSVKMRDGNTGNAAIFTGSNLPRIEEGAPRTDTHVVPSGINTNLVQMTRANTQTSSYLTKLQIIRDVQVEEGDLLTVTFNSNGGSAIAPVVVASGQAVAKPTDPTWAHHRFNEWQLAGSAYDFSSAVTTDITLVANWTQLYTISFAAGDGSGDAPAAIADKAKDETFEVPANTFTAPEGKEFDKWNDGSADYAPGATYTVGTANVVLTAQWKAVTAKYTVIFKDGETTLDTKLFEVGSNPSDADIDKTKPLFAFAAWQKDAADIALDDAYWATVVKDASVTLTARWTKAYATSYDMEAYAASVGASKAGLEAALTAANYAFTNINGIDNEHTHNYTYDGMKYKTTDGDLSFNVLGGKVVEVKTGHLPTNDAVTMYINGVADATVFEGANEDVETHKTNYFYSAAEALYRLEVLASKGTCSVKKVTIRDPFTVTFNANGGDPVAPQDGLPSVTLPDASNGTKSLLGWFDAAEGGNKIGDVGESYTPAADIELFAQWEDVSTDARLASITLDPSTGVWEPAFNPEVVNYTYTMPYPTAAVPTITGATAVNANAKAPVIDAQAANWGDVAHIHGVAQSDDTKDYYITMQIAPKDGVSIIKVATTGGTNKTVTGLYAGDGDVNLSSNTKMDNGKYIGFTLDGTTLQAGDRINVHTTEAANTGGSHIIFYDNMTSKTELYETGEIGGTGDNIFEINAAMVGSATAYVYRANNDAAHQWNGKVDFIEVTRAMNPVLTAITIDGRDGEIDALDDKHFSVTIPYEAVLSSLTVVPTIVRNAAHPTTPEAVISNEGAWILGDNTYRIMDKDGDYTDYTITLDRDVLKHTVSFNTHGGTAIDPVLVAHGEYLVAAPADPTKDDYLFQGWAETEDGSIVDVTSFTITADKEFHAVWVADGAIKLLDGSTVNHTNFITAVTADETVEFQGNTVNYAKFSGTCSGVNSVKDLTRVIAYNATTNKTKIRISAHNNSTSARNILVKGLVEGASAAVDLATVALGNKEDKVSDWIEFDNAANRTIYIMVSSSAGDVYFTQVKVVESGETPMKQAGEAGYSLNLNKGRAFGKADDEVVFEGLNIELIGDYTALNSGNLKMNSSSISFAVAAPVTLNVTTANNKTYYVANSASGTDNETAFTGVSEFSLTAGTWFINAGDADVQLTNIAFSAPKCEKPAITAIADVDLCEGDAFTALVASASVSDGGTLHYAWFKEAGATDEAVGTDAASFTPDADGEYYVIVTNQLTGFADNTETSNVVTVQHLSGTTITTAPVSVRNDVDEMATLTVVAAGKNLSYKWYTCNADGSNAEVIAGEESDSYSVTITADMSQYYKVIVHGDCGDAEAIAKVEEWKELTQVDVAESTVWNWVNAGENNKLVSGKNVEILMANIRENDKIPTNDATFNSQALLFYGENVRAVEGGRAYASVGHISFNTTVPGVVVVEFSDNGSNNRRVSINGKLSESSATKTDVKTFSANVPAGDVTIMGVKDDGTGSNQYIRISKIEFVKVDYTRPVTAGRLGTICLPNGGKMYGAGLYEIAYFDATAKKIFFDEIINGEMIAGRPYIFLPNEGVDLLAVAYTDNADADAGNYKGLYGSYTQEELGTDGSNYILLNNQYCRVVEAHTYVGANRAYIKLGEIGTTPYAAAPGRRRISMGVTGENQAQGFENLQSGDQPMKVMIDGTLYIIRGEKVFDATGRLVK